MKILALELTTARGGLAWKEGEIELVREWPNDRKHSGLFFENLAELQKQFGLPEIIIVGLGPGSYAGTRIAISAAIGLQLAANARLIGYPSIAAIETEENEYGVIGDARRSAFFFAKIRSHDLVEGPVLLSEAELKEKLNKFDNKMPIFSSEPLPQFKCTVVGHPSALVLARLAQNHDRSFSLPPLEPMYLREPHITVPRSATIS